MAKKIAEQLIDTLVKSGVERIYAVTGDSLNEVNEAVRKNDQIKWIHVRHEETGAYAAAAEAQLTGRPGCCAGSSGPGHVHLINGLYDAHRSGAPVIAIASTIPTGEFGTEYFQETNTIKLFNDCSYYNEVATTTRQFSPFKQDGRQLLLFPYIPHRNSNSFFGYNNRMLPIQGAYKRQKADRTGGGFGNGAAGHFRFICQVIIDSSKT